MYIPMHLIFSPVAHASSPARRRTRRHAVIALAAITLALAPSLARASVGDRSPAYQRCTASCRAELCDARDRPPRRDSPFAAYSPSLLWPCADTCSYACQQHLTDLALASGRAQTTRSTPQHDHDEPALQDPGGELEGLPLRRQVQFHGKWPFHRLDLSSVPLVPFLPLRLVGFFLPRAQEPLSVAFSLANLWAHYRGLHQLRALSRTGRMTEGRRLAQVYGAYAWSGILAWVASAVFHTRDTPWTERGDYFLAAVTMLVGLWAGVVRLQGWYASSSKGARLAPAQRRAAGVWTLALVGVFALHCMYLVRRERFDYAYNMRFNVGVALATIALWAAWVARQASLPTPSNFSRRQLSSYPSARARFRAPHYLAPLMPLVLLPTLTALELLDFAPIGPFGLRLLDAHALWHLSTVPVVRAWYAFLDKDVRWIDGQGEGGDPGSVLPAAPSLGGSGEAPAGGGRSTLERLLSGARSMTLLGKRLGHGIWSRVGGPAADGSLGSQAQGRDRGGGAGPAEGAARGERRD